LRNLFESTRIALVFLDRSMVIRSFTPAASSIFNLISTDRGRPLTDIVSTVDLGDLKRDIQIVFERGETIERRVRKIDGDVHYLMRLLPYLGRHNAIEGVIVTFIDVSKLVEGETHQRAMVEELNHRVRNMLTVVNAVATQTANRSSSIADFKASFLGRIQAMAKSHNLLSREQWSSILLKDILSIEFDAYRTGAQDRIALSGSDDVAIRPGASLALGMVLHEMTTNAAKYGALSNAEGKLAVQWEIDEDQKGRRALVINWKESKGPPVKAPKRGGFGSELVDREIKGALRGTIVRDFAATGLKAQITIPLDGAVESKENS
jgi:two-component system, chemotaxis family, CheB/CheR fusion protein